MPLCRHIGQDIEIALGGKHGPEGVVPIEGRFQVAALGNGRFTTIGQVTGKRAVDVGQMAFLVVGGVGIVVTSKRIQAHDKAPFLHVGVDPEKARVLVLKSTCHFRAEFEGLAQEVIVAVSPGAFNADPASYPYQRLREGVRLRPLGPAFKR